MTIAYKDYESCFEGLLSNNGSFTIHQHNLRVLAIEMYEITNKVSQIFMWDMVEEMNTKFHRSSCEINITRMIKKANGGLYKIKTTWFGFQSFRLLGSKMWAFIPDELRYIKSLNVFNKE